MKFELSERAKADVRRIYLEGAQQFGFAQADAYFDGLTEAFQLLATFPLAWPERSELNPPARVYPYKSHVVLYAVLPGGIRILTVRHGREDWLPSLP